MDVNSVGANLLGCKTFSYHVVSVFRCMSSCIQFSIPLPVIDPLHKWRLHLNNNTYTSLASHSCKKSFVLKHEYEAKDVSSIVIQI